MISNLLKNKLGGDIFGVHVSMSDSISSEILGRLGYDFVWIDTEHSGMSYTDLRHHISAVHGGGTPAIVRVSMNDYNHVKRVMELGPDGLVFPMINTPDEAENAVKSCMYPPDGRRGMGPLLATHYGVDDTDEYISTVNQNTCRLLQIETKQAVENLPEILKVPYIDGFIFGACDLSGSIGQLNNVFGEDTIALIRRAIVILKEAGMPIGISTYSTDPKVLSFWHDLGINIISTGCDFNFIYEGARDNIARLKKGLK